MSNDEVGLVLVGLTVFFAILGFALSTQGLRKVKTAVEETEKTAGEAKVAVAQAQQAITESTGPPAQEVAHNTAEVAKTTNLIQEQIAGVNAALEGLTGLQAPARVAWSLCALCLVGAFVSFDLVSLTLAPDADAPGS